MQSLFLQLRVIVVWMFILVSRREKIISSVRRTMCSIDYNSSFSWALSPDMRLKMPGYHAHWFSIVVDKYDKLCACHIELIVVVVWQDANFGETQPIVYEKEINISIQKARKKASFLIGTGENKKYVWFVENCVW